MKINIQNHLKTLIYFLACSNIQQINAQPSDLNWPRCGMNLEWQELMKWTPTIPFNNLFKIADPFDGASSYDSAGYPLTGLPATSQVYIGENLPLGNYKIRWEGQGSFNIIIGTETYSFDGVSPSNGVEVAVNNSLAEISITINTTTDGDHVRNLRMYLPGYDDNSAHQFNVCYTDLFQSPIDVIRPMWWTMIPESDIENWSDRPKLSNYSYGGDDDNVVNHGAPYEDMIDLSNITNSDLWICVPVMANDNYVTQLALLIKDRLDNDLNVFVEYSNESTWNYWPEFHHNQSLTDVGLVGYNGDDGDIYPVHKFAARTAQIIELFDAAFDEEKDRIIGVLAGQAGYSVPFLYMIDAVEWMGKMDLIDAFSIAPYVGAGYLIADSWPNTDAIFDAMDNFSRDVMNGKEAPGPKDDKGTPFTDFVQYAEMHNKKLIAYEAGQHFVSWSIGDIGGGVTAEQVATVNSHARMYNWYQHYLNAWFDHDVTSTCVFYTSTSNCPSGGSCFGTVESCNQPLEDAHKFRGILDWLDRANDGVAPSKPLNLREMEVPGTSMGLQWDAASDNVGVFEYIIYVNDIAVDSTSSTQISLEKMETGKDYSVNIEAKDVAGNRSDKSNTLDLTLLESNENNIEAGVSVFPIPSVQGLIDISFEGLDIESTNVVDLNGRSIPYSQDKRSDLISLRLPNESGLYIIILGTDKGIISKKMIVE